MLTKEEKREIRKSRRVVVRDMKKIWAMHPYEKIEVPVNLNMREYGDNWKLKIDKKGMILSNGMHYTKLYPRKVLFKNEAGYIAHSQFITQYESVREEILRIVNSRIRNKDEHIKKLESVSSSISHKEKEKPKEAEVTIDLPGSMNTKEIIVTEEGNKKVGIIDFGKQTIKIITEGNIVLVNKPKEDVKAKGK